MEEGKKKENWIEWFNNNKTTTVFFIIAFICSTITILAFCRSTNLLHESQRKIVENQTAHINKIDTVFSTIQARTSKSFELNNEKLQKLITDSLLKKTPKLDSSQKLEVAKYVKIIISTSATELAYNDWIKELNTTLPQKEIAQIQLESKSLIELEFNKIQNEYDTLALWGGILTIVFLIFSFYSLFKTDDLMKQGRDGIDKLYLIQEKADTIIVEQQKKAEESLEALRKKTESELKTQQDAIKEVQARIDKSVEEKATQLARITDDFQQKLDKEFDNQKTKFALEFDTYQKQWRDLLDDIKEFSLSTDNSKEPEVKIENENPEKK